MHIGYVSQAGRGATDRVLAAVVERLEQRSIHLAGTVQSNIERTARHVCDMDLRILPDGPTFRISQDLGAVATGCRLDSGALEQAVFEASRRLDGARILIVNKFGKSEAEGRGFRGLIAEGLARGLPVLVGVNGLNLPAFQEFAGDLARPLDADPERIVEWACSRLSLATI